MDWEFDILYAIQSIRTPFLDKVMAFLSTIGNAGALWIVIGVVLCISKKYRRGGMQMLSAELLSFLHCLFAWCDEVDIVAHEQIFPVIDGKDQK